MELEVGTRLKKIREEKKLNKKEISEMIGISYSYYKAIENGTKSPSLDIINRIAKSLSISPLYLLNDRVEIMETLVSEEEKRLRQIFEDIPEKNKRLVTGLITQAARLKVLLDDNWKDILENGEYEKFRQSENQLPYDRKRPIVENYDNRDKTFKEIIGQLTELLPKNKNKPAARNRLLKNNANK